MQGLARLAQRRRQIAALRAELAKLSQKSSAKKTAFHAEQMSLAWFRLHNAAYMLRLLDKKLKQLCSQHAGLDHF